jgi:hypothetical protein
LDHLAVTLAHHDDEIGGKTLLHRRKPPPLIERLHHILAGEAIRVRVRGIHPGVWIDDHENGSGTENISRKKVLFLILGGSKRTAKDDHSECE